MRRVIDYFVLDALANDLESLDDIVRILNSPSLELGWRDLHPEEFTLSEILAAIRRGIQDGNIIACIPSEDDGSLVDAEEGIAPSGLVAGVWFRLTNPGRQVLHAWQVPEAPKRNDV